jgi:hypothetical protein
MLMTHSTEPVLIKLDDRGVSWMAACAMAALSAEGYEVARIDDETELPTGRKDAFHADFYWSGASGEQCEMTQATHLAVQVRSPAASDEECAYEQQTLANRVNIAHGGTLSELGFFNH